VVLAAVRLAVLVLVAAPTTMADVAAALVVLQTEAVAVAVAVCAISDLVIRQRQQEVVALEL
jgi:hypothetical protein